MRQVDAGLITGLASTIVLAEVLVQPIRVGNHTLAKRYEAILSDSHHFQLEPVATATARYAADLRARYNLRTPDALHIATSIVSGCDAFLTNDSSLKRVSEINILVLDALETDLS